MKGIENPFVIKGEIPEELFCDRIEERERLTTLIINGNNVVLTSPRRVGKTGLINFCFNQNKFKDEYYTIFCDILETSSLKEFTYLLGKKIFDTLKPQSRKMMELFIQTVRSLSGSFTFDAVTGLPKFALSLGSIQNPEYTLDEIFEYIEKADRRCVIAIDEFQQITRYPEKNIEALLRTHIQHCRNAEFIFAGSERHILAEMFNSYSRPFYASTSSLALNEIPLEKYAEFADKLFSMYGKKVERDAIEYVYKLFNGNTFCLQMCFNRAFSLTAKGDKCTKESVEKAIADIISENDHAYKLKLSLLSSRNKELLIAIAKEGEAEKITSGRFIGRYALASSSSVQTSAKQLIADDWITYSFAEKGKIYRLTDYFLMMWIRNNY